MVYLFHFFSIRTKASDPIFKKNHSIVSEGCILYSKKNMHQWTKFWLNKAWIPLINQTSCL